MSENGIRRDNHVMGRRGAALRASKCRRERERRRSVLEAPRLYLTRRAGGVCGSALSGVPRKERVQVRKFTVDEEYQPSQPLAKSVSSGGAVCGGGLGADPDIGSSARPYDQL